MNLACAILSYLLAVASAKLVFTDVTIYGINRCVVDGLGPTVRKIGLRGPFRFGLDEDKSIASLEFDDNDDIVVQAKNGGSAGFLKHGSLMTGEDSEENVRNDDRGMVITNVEAGDFVMAIIKHTPNLDLNHVQYDSVFKGHGDDTIELTKMFVDKYGHLGSFTLVTALVKEASAGQEHYFTLIPDRS